MTFDTSPAPSTPPQDVPDTDGNRPVGPTDTGQINFYAILELMGHRRLAGYVREVQIGGQSLLRIDIPASNGTVTQFYSIAAVYAITPTTKAVAEEIARQVPEPVSAWDVRRLMPPRTTQELEVNHEDDDDEDEYYYLETPGVANPVLRRRATKETS